MKVYNKNLLAGHCGWSILMDCPVFNCVHKAFPLSPLRRIWTTSAIHSTWCYIWAHAFTLSRDKLIKSSAKEVDHCLRFATVVVHWLRVVTYNSMNCIATPLVVFVFYFAPGGLVDIATRQWWHWVHLIIVIGIVLYDVCPWLNRCWPIAGYFPRSFIVSIKSATKILRLS